MLSSLKYIILLVFLADLVLLGVMVHFTSWPFTIAFVLLSGIIGGWVVNDGFRNYIRKGQLSVNARNMSAQDFMIGAMARLAAGMLLIVPGVLTDIVALCLLSPAGKWLTKVLFASLFIMIAPRFQLNPFDFQPTDDEAPKDEIIDVKIINSDVDKLEHEN
jgi:UPF0716 family protein affecting phage T7 exclusion